MVYIYGHIYIYFSCDCNNLTKGVASGIHGKKTERRTNIRDGEGLFDSRVNRGNVFFS